MQWSELARCPRQHTLVQQRKGCCIYTGSGILLQYMHAVRGSLNLSYTLARREFSLEKQESYFQDPA